MTTTHITNIIDWLNQYNLATTWTALAEKELNDLLAERTALADEVADLKTKLESAEYNLQLSVQGEIAANNTNQILEEDVKKQDAELIGLHGEKEALKQRCQWAENELSEANGTAAFQTERANDMAAQRDSWIERAAKAKSEINNLKYSKLSAIENLGNAEKRMMEAEKHEAELQKIREAQSKRIAELESENANLRSVIDSEKQSYQATIERATRERDTALQNQNAYYRNYTEQFDLREKAEARVKELEAENNRFRDQYNQQCDINERDFREKEDEISELQSELRNRVAACHLASEIGDELAEKIKKAEARVKELEAENTRLRGAETTCEVLAKIAEDRMEEIRQLKAECKTTPPHPVFRPDAFFAEINEREAKKAVLTQPVAEIPEQPAKPPMPPEVAKMDRDWTDLEYEEVVEALRRLARDVYQTEPTKGIES